MRVAPAPEAAGASAIELSFGRTFEVAKLGQLQSSRQRWRKEPSAVKFFRFSRRRLLQALAAWILLLYPAIVAIAWLRPLLDSAEPSQSSGDAGHGQLRYGRAMRPSGPGYRTYSYLGSALGRQYVHADVRDTLEAAFARCALGQKERVFILGESGARHGGPFWPHRTHQNGLSVDIFVPIRDPQGRPLTLSTWPWNRFGYDVEFDRSGRVGQWVIDFDGLAELLGELRVEASKHRLRLGRIILTPEYLPLLINTEHGALLEPLREVFLKTPAWVRHDEHVHVEFVSER